ncbi:hypothetical protein PTKIN_Ptkin08bG0036500 [Pterospermum kingtungense]
MDSTGRLMKYDLRTKQVTVLFRNLSGAVGVAVDENEKFVLAAEFITNRTIKIWLKDPKAKKFDIINRQSIPDNIKRTTSGKFWLAAAMVNRRSQSLVPIGKKINKFGRVVQTVDFERWCGDTAISEVQVYDGNALLLMYCNCGCIEEEACHAFEEMYLAKRPQIFFESLKLKAAGAKPDDTTMATSGRWADASKMRMKMRNTGVKKIPGLRLRRSTVVDEDAPQLADSDEYPGHLGHGRGVQSEEEDGSDDCRSYLSVIFTATEQQQQHEEQPLGWWFWS